MERLINLHIEHCPEGFFLATSDEVRGLMAQGNTVTETLETARDVARVLLDAESDDSMKGAPVADRFDYPLVVPV